MTQAEAARVLGVSRPRVHALLKSGKLQGSQVGNRLIVIDASVYARLYGWKQPIIKTSHVEQTIAKRCTQCQVELSKENTFLQDGNLYSRCKGCHTRSTMYDSYRKNAEKRNLPFNLTREQFSALTHEPCAYCGGTYHKGYNGVDRIHSDHGYEPWNVTAACKTCNLAKNNMPIKEWVAWLKRIKAAPMPTIKGVKQ